MSRPQTSAAPCPFYPPGRIPGLVTMHWAGHRRVTHSRNRVELRGHARKRSKRVSSSAGHWRSPKDTGGDGMTSVRDREAPGTNPGPPTKF
jgi:hypothetical protein